MPRSFSLRIDRQSYWLFPLVLIGLVERRGEALDDGFRRLMDSAAAHRNLDLEAVVADLTDGQPRHDDLVLLAVRTLRK